jgi:ribose transport system substrate-binding protein
MKTILKRALGLTAAAVAALILSGCGDQPAAGGAKPAAGKAPEPTKAKKLSLAFLTNNASMFWTIARKGCDDAVKELGNVDLDFRIPASGSAAEQQQILDDLTAKGIAGVAVSPVDPSNQTDALNKVAAQTLLVTHDSDAPKSKRKCYIGTDNHAAGVEAGKLLKEALPNGGKVMVFVGTLDAQNAKERFGGLKEAIAGSKIQIIDTRTDETDRVRAKTNVQDALVKYPDLAGLVGLWSYNGPAICDAVKEAGQAGKVKIVCFDEEEPTLAGVADGTIYATVVQQPYEFGKQAIERMAKYAGGDTNAFPAGGILAVPTLNIKKDNVAAFKAKLNSMLGK